MAKQNMGTLGKKNKIQQRSSGIEGSNTGKYTFCKKWVSIKGVGFHRCPTS